MPKPPHRHTAHRGARALLLYAALALPSTGCATQSESQPVAERPSPTRRVLIITGEDYAGHAWRETTPVLEAAIEADARLEVDVFQDLAALSRKDLTPYAAVLLHFKNYDPAVPGRQAFDALNDYVDEGGGLLLAHFACGAFEEFKGDFEALAGRVWFGEQPPPGRAQHDRYGEFTVHITDTAHPVTRELSDFTTSDELYTCLEGESPVEVLAEAVSNRDGKRYPLAFALQRGKGRVFHCVLGHDPAALSVDGVGQLYRRAAAWAAGLDPDGLTSEQDH